MDLVKNGEPVPLAECPIGLFECFGELCVKTEYAQADGRIDAFIVSSGEFFAGPKPQTTEVQRACLVQPFVVREAIAASQKQDNPA